MPSERRGRSPSISPRREQGPTRPLSVSPCRKPIPESLKKGRAPSESPSETKSCTSCNEVLAMEKFKTNGSKPDGTKYRMATCRNCMDRQKAERLMSESICGGSSGTSKNDILLELARGLSKLSENINKVSSDMTTMSCNINSSE